MKSWWEHPIGLIGLVMLLGAQYYGLFVTPADAMMGDVARILYVHVPSAWNGFLWLGIACLCAIAYLLSDLVAFAAAILGKPLGPGALGLVRRYLDHTLAATIEVGTLLVLVLTMQGSIFAKPTWGVWWTWDPRLTSTAVMLFTFVGVLVMRAIIPRAQVRASLSAAVTVMAAVTIPITYLSVRIWRSMHQIQTGGTDIDGSMYTAWMVNFFALILVTLWMVIRRWRIAKATWDADEAPPLPEVA